MDEMRPQIEQRLRDFWRERSIAVTDSPTSTDELGAPLDSITSMEVIMEIDALVNRELPVERVIRQGGYVSEEDFVSEVTSRVLEVIAEPVHE